MYTRTQAHSSSSSSYELLCPAALQAGDGYSLLIKPEVKAGVSDPTWGSWTVTSPSPGNLKAIFFFLFIFSHKKLKAVLRLIQSNGNFVGLQWFIILPLTFGYLQFMMLRAICLEKIQLVLNTDAEAAATVFAILKHMLMKKYLLEVSKLKKTLYSGCILGWRM